MSMWTVLLGAALISGPAEAGEKRQARKERKRRARRAQKDEPINPEISTDYTAFTVEQRQWRVGLINTDYGLTDSIQLRTSPLGWLLGPNAQAKLQVAEIGPVDLSLGSGVFYVNLARLGQADPDAVDANFLMAPIEWKASWTIRERWGVHFGTQHRVVKLNGGLSGGDIGSILAALTGDDEVGAQLEGLGTGVYGDAQLWQHQTRFAIDFHVNRQGSVMLLSNNTFAINGMVLAGAGTSDEDSGTSTTVGAGVKLSSTLETLPSAVSLNYQWSWPRFHLRLGLPLSPGNPLVYTQVVNFYWVLGPKPRT